MRIILLPLSFLFASCIGGAGQESKEDRRPNIVLIVADDLGYSDLSCFGSEIRTPNIDNLANEGRIFSNFYTAATCSPTRAMLLSGTDHHIAGLGNMYEQAYYIDEQRNQPGYEGYLNDRVLAFPQLLSESGYKTYMAGKWHIGWLPEHSPTARGFDRSFSLMTAYADHFQPNPEYDIFWEDGDYAQYPDGSYSTDLYTDKLLGYLRSHSGDQPFFLYAAYTAPHWPLQALPEDISKFSGSYDEGYDVLREKRFIGLKESGIIENNLEMPDLPDNKGMLYEVSEEELRSWEELNVHEKRTEARKMEIYAAMVHNLDQNIGRIIGYLKESGQYENTAFIFCSDNGAAVLEDSYTPPDTDPLDYMGRAGSFVAYGPQWAHASMAAYQFYKGYPSEGGLRSPMIAKLPGQSQGQKISRAFTTVKDIAPTLLEIAEISYPEKFRGKSTSPLQGASFVSAIEGTEDTVHKKDYVMGWELFGRAAVRKGDWKISMMEAPFGSGEFQLFDLANDPSEILDVAQENPTIYRELLDLWETYKAENGVIFIDEY